MWDEDQFGCSQCEGIESRFDRAYVEKKLEKYHKRGPKITTQLLVEALRAQGISGLTLLDIGGGIGDIIHGLAPDCVASAVNVEASPAYASACIEEAAERGLADKVEVLRGDFTELEESISPADIVTLDRVICCFHDMPELVARSVAKAKRFYGAVYPKDAWWVKVSVAIFYNLRFWIQRNPLRIFVHPTDKIESLIESAGFERIYHEVRGSWEIALYATGKSRSGD